MFLVPPQILNLKTAANFEIGLTLVAKETVMVYGFNYNFPFVKRYIMVICILALSYLPKNVEKYSEGIHKYPLKSIG